VLWSPSSGSKYPSARQTFLALYAGLCSSSSRRSASAPASRYAPQQQAMLYGLLLIMPFALLSGLTTPLTNMPLPLQYFTAINPLRYAIDITQSVYLEGVGLGRLNRGSDPAHADRCRHPGGRLLAVPPEAPVMRGLTRTARASQGRQPSPCRSVRPPVRSVRTSRGRGRMSANWSATSSPADPVRRSPRHSGLRLWTSFNDPVLTSLIERADGANLYIRHNAALRIAKPGPAIVQIQRAALCRA